MTNYLNSNAILFNGISLSTDNVLLEPKTGTVLSRRDVMLSKPIIFSSPMDTVTGISLIRAMLRTSQSPVSCRFKSDSHRIQELNAFNKDNNYWFSVSSSEDDFNLVSTWAKKNSNQPLNIAVDVAHGDTLHLHKIYKLYSSQVWCRSLMSGPIATFPSALKVYNRGCTHLRVGMGTGSASIATGCGVPNLSAIFQVWQGFDDLALTQMAKTRPYIIANGGIRGAGDIAKHLSAGADAVMIGNLLSKTTESAGWKTNLFYKILNRITFKKYFKKYLYKKYRGQTSVAFQPKYRGHTPEGVQAPIQHPEYHYKDFFLKVTFALQCSASYLGLNSINKMCPETVKFIRITNSSHSESTPNY